MNRNISRASKQNKTKNERLLGRDIDDEFSSFHRNFQFTAAYAIRGHWEATGMHS